MKARDAAARAATAVIGSAPVAAIARARNAGRLRILDYHDISDAAAFDAQMAFLARAYRPVGEAEVLAAIAGGPALPPHAVWVTFDDGHPSVVEAGLEVLRRHGIPATFYVCPGLIEAQEPPWWELVLAAGRVGEGATVEGVDLQGEALVRALKRQPDRERREVVAKLRPLAVDHLEPDQEALTVGLLDRWVDAGFDVGNHTWDHPCLHRCEEDEQRRQIELAHDWLVRYRPEAFPTFAYPNGDHTLAAESVLVGLGYALALLSDHRLTDLEGSPQGLSRLRLDSSDPVSRCRAVVSGVHSAGYAGALRLGLTGPNWADR